MRFSETCIGIYALKMTQTMDWMEEVFPLAKSQIPWEKTPKSIHGSERNKKGTKMAGYQVNSHSILQTAFHFLHSHISGHTKGLQWMH